MCYLIILFIITEIKIIVNHLAEKEEISLPRCYTRDHHVTTTTVH